LWGPSGQVPAGQLNILNPAYLRAIQPFLALSGGPSGRLTGASAPSPKSLEFRIEGHLEVYWKSAALLVVVDAEQLNGWQQLHNSYVSGYSDPSPLAVYSASNDLVYFA